MSIHEVRIKTCTLALRISRQALEDAVVHDRNALGDSLLGPCDNIRPLTALRPGENGQRGDGA